MTKEELEKTWVRNRVKMVDPYIPIGCDCAAVEEGETGVVDCVDFISEEENYLYVKWDNGSRTSLATFRHELFDSKPPVSKKDYPHTCPRCGAPSYNGLTYVDCSKGCK